MGVPTSLVVAKLLENSQKSPKFRKPEIENGKRIGTRRYIKICETCIYEYIYYTILLIGLRRINQVGLDFPPPSVQFRQNFFESGQLLQNVLQTFDLRVRYLAVRLVHHVVVDKWCNIM